MLHALSRAELLLGKEGIEMLRSCRVAIFGIGGVGSYVAEALVRCGVGHFVLIDDDRLCLTNLNRQVHATLRTVGHPKVEAMRDRMLEIMPDVEIQCLQEFYLPGKADELLSGGLDYIVDAVDTVTAKIDLVVEAGKRHIPIISAMGAGNKVDPTRFEVADIYQTSQCPLARVMRRELRARGVPSLKVVYSRETPLVPRESDDNSCSAGCICPKGTPRTCTIRHQIPGSVSFVPPVAGLILAGEVVKDLIRRVNGVDQSST
jgi:tRNA A37 threonylcarbamoyladenosine dehydratase